MRSAAAQPLRNVPVDVPRECEVSVVMPCLNESDTLATCIQKAQKALTDAGIDGEIVIADNGSTDGSPEIATSLGARVVPVTARGYGNALMGGISAARGKYIIMGDADDSYDFLEIPSFVRELRRGHAMVQGCRLPSGGGRVAKGAMPFSHRWFGNPMFSMLARWMFGAPIHDVYCGMRGFTKELFNRLDFRCTGMEFATEMIIKSALYKEKFAEVPITLHPDGRKKHASHLRTFRDGWRTLRFFLMYSPDWIFLVPGLALILASLTGYALAMSGATILHAAVGMHTLLVASLAFMMGYQTILFAVVTKTFAITEGLRPEDPWLSKLFQKVTLERGLLLGGVLGLVGLVLIAITANEWRVVGFGDLVYEHTLRKVIPGVMLVVCGFQTICSSFFVSMLGVSRKK